MKVGIPALAGLSVLHGLVPPHPGPLTAIGLLNADLGRTLLFGILIAIPTVIVAGPVLARFVDQWVPKSRTVRAGPRPEGRGRVAVGGSRRHGSASAARWDATPRSTTSGGEPRLSRPGASGSASRRPSSASPCPVVLMLIDAITKLAVTDEETGVRQVVDFIGTPIVALLIAVHLLLLRARPRAPA